MLLLYVESEEAKSLPICGVVIFTYLLWNNKKTQRTKKNEIKKALLLWRVFALHTNPPSEPVTPDVET